MNFEFTIYRATRHDLSIKIPHVRKVCGKVYGGFCHDFGDIPTAVIVRSGFSDIETRDVVNTRGNAYALRNAKKYRNKKRYSRKGMNV